MGGCYGLNRVPTNSCVEALTPSATVFGIRKKLRLKDLHSYRRDTGRLTLSPLHEDTARRRPSANQERAFPRDLSAWHLDLRLPSLQTVRKNTSLV